MHTHRAPSDELNDAVAALEPRMKRHMLRGSRYKRTRDIRFRFCHRDGSGAVHILHHALFFFFFASAYRRKASAREAGGPRPTARPVEKFACRITFGCRLACRRVAWFAVSCRGTFTAHHWHMRRAWPGTRSLQGRSARDVMSIFATGETMPSRVKKSASRNFFTAHTRAVTYR